MGHNLCYEDGSDVAGGKGHWACLDMHAERLIVSEHENGEVHFPFSVG